MSDIEQILLTDRNIPPTDKYIFSVMGEKKVLWQEIMEHMTKNYKDSAGTWNFYNDGKRWLFKMVYKKKTVFWAALIEGGFRVTFYFGKKAWLVIENSDLPEQIKEDFRTAKTFGLLKPVRFVVTGKSDVESILKLIEIKSKLK